MLETPVHDDDVVQEQIIEEEGKGYDDDVASEINRAKEALRLSKGYGHFVRSRSRLQILARSGFEEDLQCVGPGQAVRNALQKLLSTIDVSLVLTDFVANI